MASMAQLHYVESLLNHHMGTRFVDYEYGRTVPSGRMSALIDDMVTHGSPQSDDARDLARRLTENG